MVRGLPSFHFVCDVRVDDGVLRARACRHRQNDYSVKDKELVEALLVEANDVPYRRQKREQATSENRECGKAFYELHASCQLSESQATVYINVIVRLH
jgi:hypothetical protein